MEVRKIPLTQGKVAIVDAADYEWLMQWKWAASRDTKTQNWYAKRTDYQNPAGKKRDIRMHRLIMSATHNTEVDHIDGDGLNNQRSNLRLCSHAQNMRNMKPHQGNSSKYKGVTWNKRAKKWRAQIGQTTGHKRRHLGYFPSEIQAAIAYNVAAADLFGEFARLNQIDPSVNK